MAFQISLDFRFEHCLYLFEIASIDRRDLAENALVVAARDLVIDERQIEPRDLSRGINPNFSSQLAISSAFGYLVRLVHAL